METVNKDFVIEKGVLTLVNGVAPEKANTVIMTDTDLLDVEICKADQEIGIREYWIRKGIETEEPFYEGMMARMLGYEPSLWNVDPDERCARIAEAAEAYMKKTARFIIAGSQYSSRVLEDNRAAAEIAAGNLRDLLDRAGCTESGIALYPSVR